MSAAASDIPTALAKPNRQGAARRKEGEDFFVGGVRSTQKASSNQETSSRSSGRRSSKVRRNWKKCLDYRTEGYPAVGRDHIVEAYSTVSIPRPPKKGNTWGWRETNILLDESRRRRARARWLQNLAERLKRVEELEKHINPQNMEDLLGAAMRYINDGGTAVAYARAKEAAELAVTRASECTDVALSFASESWAGKIAHTSEEGMERLSVRFQHLLEGFCSLEYICQHASDARQRIQKAMECLFERLDLTPLYERRPSLKGAVKALLAWELPTHSTREKLYADILRDAEETSLSERQIAERHGVAWRTVRAALQGQKPKERKRYVLQDTLSYIEQRLKADPQVSAQAIWHDLTTIYDCTVSQSHVRNVVAKIRAAQSLETTPTWMQERSFKRYVAEK